MHIPDGFLNNPVSFGAGLGALGALAHSLKKVAQELKLKVAVLQHKLAGNTGSQLVGGKSFGLSFANRKVEQMASLAALIFALQMINFPVLNGTSGHFIGAALATAVVGPWAAILVLSLVVTLQAVVFADGGLIVLGANMLNIAVFPSLLAMLVITLAKRLTDSPLRKIVSLTVAAWISVMLAATACSFELALSGTIALGDVLTAMLGVHALIGIGEALITLAFFQLFFSRQSTYLQPEESQHA
ncbi:MAG TPA: energy-coupling factor ABC transporter permease [bacterium]|nr:energy-coupling factor ABC transporter permease [bacterium]